MHSDVTGVEQLRAALCRAALPTVARHEARNRIHCRLKVLLDDLCISLRRGVACRARAGCIFGGVKISGRSRRKRATDAQTMSLRYLRSSSEDEAAEGSVQHAHAPCASADDELDAVLEMGKSAAPKSLEGLLGDNNTPVDRPLTGVRCYKTFNGEQSSRPSTPIRDGSPTGAHSGDVPFKRESLHNIGSHDTLLAKLSYAGSPSAESFASAPETPASGSAVSNAMDTDVPPHAHDTVAPEYARFAPHGGTVQHGGVASVTTSPQTPSPQWEEPPPPPRMQTSAESAAVPTGDASSSSAAASAAGAHVLPALSAQDAADSEAHALRHTAFLPTVPLVRSLIDQATGCAAAGEQASNAADEGDSRSGGQEALLAAPAPQTEQQATRQQTAQETLKRAVRQCERDNVERSFAFCDGVFLLATCGGGVAASSPTTLHVNVRPPKRGGGAQFALLLYSRRPLESLSVRWETIQTPLPGRRDGCEYCVPAHRNRAAAKESFAAKHTTEWFQAILTRGHESKRVCQLARLACAAYDKPMQLPNDDAANIFQCFTLAKFSLDKAWSTEENVADDLALFVFENGRQCATMRLEKWHKQTSVHCVPHFRRANVRAQSASQKDPTVSFDASAVPPLSPSVTLLDGTAGSQYCADCGSLLTLGGADHVLLKVDRREQAHFVCIDYPPPQSAFAWIVCLGNVSSGEVLAPIAALLSFACSGSEALEQLCGLFQRDDDDSPAQCAGAGNADLSQKDDSSEKSPMRDGNAKALGGDGSNDLAARKQREALCESVLLSCSDIQVLLPAAMLFAGAAPQGSRQRQSLTRAEIEDAMASFVRCRALSLTRRRCNALRATLSSPKQFGALLDQLCCPAPVTAATHCSECGAVRSFSSDASPTVAANDDWWWWYDGEPSALMSCLHINGDSGNAVAGSRAEAAESGASRSVDDRFGRETWHARFAECCAQQALTHNTFEWPRALREWLGAQCEAHLDGRQRQLLADAFGWQTLDEFVGNVKGLCSLKLPLCTHAGAVWRVVEERKLEWQQEAVDELVRWARRYIDTIATPDDKCRVLFANGLYWRFRTAPHLYVAGDARGFALGRGSVSCLQRPPALIDAALQLGITPSEIVELQPYDPACPGGAHFSALEARYYRAARIDLGDVAADCLDDCVCFDRFS